MRSLPESYAINLYFALLTTQLRRMPLKDRDLALVELQQHFESLAADYLEIGLLPQDAIEDALLQLGDPVALGRKLAREWRLSTRQAARIRQMPVLFAFLCLLWLAIFSVYFFDPLLAAIGTSWRPNDMVLICLPPLFAGALTGYRWPERALGAVWRAIIALAASLLGLLCLCVAGLEIVAVMHEWWTADSHWRIALNLGILPFQLITAFVLCLLRWLACWLPLGLLSAYLAGIKRPAGGRRQ